MESFWFTAKDGAKVQGFLIRPPGFDAPKKYPLKFLMHGGPQGAWGDCVVVSLECGVVCGQWLCGGDDQSARVDGVWAGLCGWRERGLGRKPFTDLMTGLDYAEKQYPFIDKTRECALGASYGGYMANWVLGHTDRFKCIVSHDGMFDPESAFGTTEEDWFNQWEFKGNPWDYYGKPDAENPYRKWSPHAVCGNFKTPTLVVHGATGLPAGCERGVSTV